MIRYKIDGIFFLLVFFISCPHLISYSKEEKPTLETHINFERLVRQASQVKPALPVKTPPVAKLEPKKVNITTVTATVYYPQAAQTDNTPLITADGSKINHKHPRKHKWIAVSRNLLTRWGGHIDYGDKVHVSGISKKLDGVYIVRDTMKRRLRNRIDILVGANDNVKGYWSDVKLTKI
jgi:3D (Asp-Asp-Asp) domain-containing protein